MQAAVFSRFKKASKEWNRFGTRDVEVLEVCEATRPRPVEKQHGEDDNQRSHRGRMSEGIKR